MSEVSWNDDVGAVLGFLFRVLRVEVHELRGHHRSHHFTEPSKESGGPRASSRCRALRSHCPPGLGFRARGDLAAVALGHGILSNHRNS